MRAPFPVILGLRILRGKAGTARYLRGSVLGIALSLVPLVVVIEVSTGMIEGITSRLIEIGSYHLEVTLPSRSTRESLELAASAVLRSGSAASVIPERQGVALLKSRKASSGVTVRFVPPDLFARDAGLRALVSFKSGSPVLSTPHGLLVGEALAERLGVRSGDRLTMLTPYSADANSPPKVSLMTVEGVFSTGYEEIEKIYAYASLSSSWTVLSPQASRTLIGVKVRDPFADLLPEIQRIRKELPPDSRISTWREIEYSYLNSFQTTKALLLFIMALIVLVAGVNVSSSVIMIAFERRFEIGILKSVGAGTSGLALSFFMAGFVTGLLGTAAGMGLGLLAAVNINGIISGIQSAVNGIMALASLVRSGIDPSTPPFPAVTIFNSAYYLSSIPIRIRFPEVLAAAVGTLALSGLASYMPAAKAARAKPLEIIRKV
jgi:lipoprotein-releasing system permease protein